MKARILKGFRDYAPAEMLARQAMLDSVRQVFESFGYEPLHTPALEYAEILLGKYGEDGEKLLYKFLDNGGREVALRYDLTVPLARFVAMNPNLRFPFRRYQIAPVWRAERPQKGRFREFYQCDVDLIGVDSPQADAECILVDCGVMAALGLKEYSIQVNHRGFLDGLLEVFQVPASSTVAVLRTMDKVDKIKSEELARQLMELGLGNDTVTGLMALSTVTGANQERLSQGLALARNNPVATQAVERLDKVFALIEAAHPGGHVQFTPSVARGLDYYTGIVYETFLPARYGVGSVMSGGRYDTLLGTMARQEIPAVGISLGIDRLVAALTAAHSETEIKCVTNVLVCTMDETEVQAAGIAGLLRRSLPQGKNGIELYPTPARLKKQFDYAHKRRIPYVVIVGAEEAQAGKVTLKKMETAQQVTVSKVELVELLLAAVSSEQ